MPRLTPTQLGDVPDAIAYALSIARRLIEQGVPIFIAKPALDAFGNWDPLGGANGSGYWLPKDWQNTAPDLTVLDRWRDGYALCAVLGHGYDVIDMDPRNGGDITVDAWRSEGLYPDVYGQASTPSGGTHDLIASLGIGTKHHGGVDLQGGSPDGKRRGFMFIAPTMKVSKTTGEVREYAWTIEPAIGQPDRDESGKALAQLLTSVRSRAHDGGTTSPPTQPSGETYWAGAADYETSAVSAELGRLVAMRDGTVRDLQDYRGEPWDATTYEVIRRISEFANSDWARLTWHDAERLILEHAPTDEGFTRDRIIEKVRRAREETVAEGKSVKVPLELKGKAEKGRPTEAKPKSDEPRGLRLVSLADVVFGVTEWAVEGLIPLGILTGLAGWAGIGKSTVTAYFIAGLTNGTFPGDLHGEPTSVLVVAGEDDTARQLGPRLAVAGADMHRVFEVQATTRLESGAEITSILSLEEDLPRIRERLVETGAKVLVLDPVLSFTAGNPNHQRDVRDALDPLAAMARELNIAILLVMHFKKGQGVAGEKVSGSHVWRDALRSLMVMANDKESGYRVVTLDKSNYGVAGRSLLFSVDSATVTGRDSKGRERPQQVSRAAYVGESSKSVDDILNEEQVKRDSRHTVESDTAEIIDWIRSQPDGARWIDICHEAGIDPNSKDDESRKAKVNLTRKLGRAVDRGDIEKVEKGLYRRPAGLQPLEGADF